MLGELDVVGHAPKVAGERLPSMMTPTLVLEDGRPRLALGSAGSVRLAGAIAQVADAVLRGTPVDEAIDLPRVHVDGDVLHLEGGLMDVAPEGWKPVRWAGRNLFFGGVSGGRAPARRHARRRRRPAPRRPRHRRRMTISIRRARPEDAAALVELGAAIGREPEAWLLNTDGWRTVGEERRYLRALRRHPDAAVYVAEDDGVIVGRLSVARDPHSASRHVADLGLMVAASHRRLGIGRALLEQAAAWAREAGVAKLELHVFPWNEPAIRLYEQFGFEREGLRKAHYRRGDEYVDAILMAYRVRSRARAAARTRRPAARSACRRAAARASSAAAAPGRAGGSPEAAPEGCWTAFQSSIETPIEKTATSALVSVGARNRGAMWSKTAVTGIASAAKLVPQRAENRVGRAAPVQVAASEPSSAAAIARCSAPCRRSVRPRKSQRTISTVVRIPAASSSRPGSATNAKGSSSATRRKSRSRSRATPRPRTSGAIDDASWSRPRTSGIRAARDRRTGISPSCSSPEMVANAQWRSLTITTPFGRAMPPSFGSDPSRVGACEEVGDGSVHLPRVAEKRPPGECRTA